MAISHTKLALLLVLSQATADRFNFLSSKSARIAVITPSAGAAPPLKESEEEALLQADADMTKMHGPNPAGWFGGFAQGESTYDLNGLNHGAGSLRDVLDGWNPHQQNPLYERAAPEKFFQETKSGGGKEAWQTYPGLSTDAAGNRVETGNWFTGQGGQLQQDYLSSTPLSNSNVPASWFDDSVNQLDGFGRIELPAIDSARNYFDWEERSVNTSLVCKAAGCTANVSLLAPFDSTKEMYKNCRLSMYMHPTDFDDQYSGENVEWVEVNNHRVSAKCHPFASGCNQTAARPLLPCVSDIPLDLLMQKSGHGDLTIAAKIPKGVDECPFKGNMLSAVPMLTCLVALKHQASGANGHQPGGAGAPKAVTSLMDQDSCITKMPLQCATKGCAAEIAIPVKASCASLGQCTLSVVARQTDFDNQEGTDELIEYIKVDGKAVKSNLKPGKNPCKTKWSGGNLSLTEMNYTALTNHVVNVTKGRVLIEGKISKYVDECASNGYLLDAVATVTCSKKGSKASLLSQGEVVASKQRRHLRVKAL